jgi:hypothetical protein
MTGVLPSVALSVVAAPPVWAILLVLGLLFGPPIAGMVYGVRSDAPRTTDYVLAGGISLALMVIWALGASAVKALLGDLLYLSAIITYIVVPAAHVHRRRVREDDGILWLAAVYTSPLFLVVADALSLL